MDCYVCILRIHCFLLQWIVTLVSRAFSLFSPVINCYVGISRILCFLLYWIVTLASRAPAIFSCNGLLRQYPAHSLFSPVIDCYVSNSYILFTPVIDQYVSISRILCFLLYWIVTLASRAPAIFSCNGLLRQYPAHSLFSPVIDCYVSNSYILFSPVIDQYVSISRTLLKSIVTFVSCAFLVFLSYSTVVCSISRNFFVCQIPLPRKYLAHSQFSVAFHCYVSSISRILFFSAVLHCYVRISRIHSFLFFNIFSKYLAHSQLPPTIFYLKTFLHSDELREMQFSCNAMQKRGKTVHIIVNVVQIMIKSPNFFGDSKS